eukprot:4765627-Alexandrium_andersonii.AAC.1
MGGRHSERCPCTPGRRGSPRSGGRSAPGGPCSGHRPGGCPRRSPTTRSGGQPGLPGSRRPWGRCWPAPSPRAYRRSRCPSHP